MLLYFHFKISFYLCIITKFFEIFFIFNLYFKLFIYLLRAEGSVNIKIFFSIFLPGGFYCLINPSLEASSNFVASLTDFVF